MSPREPTIDKRTVGPIENAFLPGVERKASPDLDAIWQKVIEEGVTAEVHDSPTRPRRRVRVLLNARNAPEEERATSCERPPTNALPLV